MQEIDIGAAVPENIRQNNIFDFGRKNMILNTVIGTLGVGDIILLLLVAVLAFFALRYCMRHKNSCSGCTGDCSACARKFREEKQGRTSDKK